MSNTSKEVDRMKKNVESMQWRIRNKFDLPVDHLTPVTSEQQNSDLLRNSLPALQADQQKQVNLKFLMCEIQFWIFSEFSKIVLI